MIVAEKIFNLNYSLNTLNLFVSGEEKLHSNFDDDSWRRFVVGTGSTNNYIDLYSNGTQYPFNQLNLFTNGINFSLSNTLDLFAYNNATIGTLLLYSKTDGTPNATPLTSSLNLYCECPLGNSIDLYCLGGPQPSQTGYLDMYTYATFNVLNSIDLSAPFCKDVFNNTLNLYTHGF